MDPRQLSFVERRTGKLVQDPIYRRSILNWLYNSAPGWFLTEYLLSRRWVSRFYGWFNKQRWSRRKINHFVRCLAINLDELTTPIESFGSFNDFIIREIDLAERPVDEHPAVCISPADGRVLVYPTISAGQSFAIKRSLFSLTGLLRDDDLAQAYSGGALMVSRLYLTDYHHFHFPDGGVPHAAVSIAGKYFAVSPYTESKWVPFYSENHRMVTLFDSDHFGQVAMVEVGAFTIGSIQQRYQPGVRVTKGDHKGFFELGGSIVVLIFHKDVVSFDEDLCYHSRRGIETYVRFGESVGRSRLRQ